MCRAWPPSPPGAGAPSAARHQLVLGVAAQRPAGGRRRGHCRCCDGGVQRNGLPLHQASDRVRDRPPPQPSETRRSSAHLMPRAGSTPSSAGRGWCGGRRCSWPNSGGKRSPLQPRDPRDQRIGLRQLLPALPLDHYNGDEMLGDHHVQRQAHERRRVGGARAGIRGSAWRRHDPFTETREYVQRVLTAQREYRSTYPRELGIGWGARQRQSAPLARGW